MKSVLGLATACSSLYNCSSRILIFWSSSCLLHKYLYYSIDLILLRRYWLYHYFRASEYVLAYIYIYRSFSMIFEFLLDEPGGFQGLPDGHKHNNQNGQNGTKILPKLFQIPSTFKVRVVQSKTHVISRDYMRRFWITCWRSLVRPSRALWRH